MTVKWQAAFCLCDAQLRGCFMNAATQEINPNPTERYYQRVRALAPSDPKLKSLLPNPTVKDAVRKPGMSCAEIIATVLAAKHLEVLLQSAQQRFRLPVNVYRGDMMLAHSRYKGQINVPDSFTRPLYSIITTGLTPESFYELATDGHRPKAHYDGWPVDFIASVRGLSSGPVVPRISEGSFTSIWRICGR
jgi:hypothetical protein